MESYCSTHNFLRVLLDLHTPIQKIVLLRGYHFESNYSILHLLINQEPPYFVKVAH